MKFVAVAACTSGIAHTYIAREKILKAAKDLGFEARCETQGTIGSENTLAAEDIKAADVVILAVDIKIAGRERFEGKKVVEVDTNTVVKNAKPLLKAVAAKLASS